VPVSTRRALADFELVKFSDQIRVTAFRGVVLTLQNPYKIA